ncbi:hypothetical protein FACS1894179_00840 [Bacteroidia bacterium]|nr:hypothetical protein FACS1894169_07930 [Bacteroidia bacterium]GHV38086.1 hypothetical protein FACS1894179_00840 [Bacteroidia bacterium]
MVTDSLQLHEPEFPVFVVQVKSAPNQCPGGNNPEPDTDNLADTDHIHNHKDYEYTQQPACEDEQVLAFESLKLGGLADSFID